MADGFEERVPGYHLGRVSESPANTMYKAYRSADVRCNAL